MVNEVFTTSKALRVTATVNTSIPSTKNYLCKIGFKQEGVKHDTCIKNNKLYNTVILGMTRRDWEAL